jgi:hypothetical protein
MKDRPNAENNNTETAPQDIKCPTGVWGTDKVGSGRGKGAIWVEGRHFLRMDGGLDRER